MCFLQTEVRYSRQNINVRQTDGQTVTRPSETRNNMIDYNMISGGGF